MSPIDPAMWQLPPISMYTRVFEINNENHDLKIMESNDVWIVIFYKKTLNKKWIDLSKILGGAVWFGSVNIEENPKLVESLKLDMKNLDDTGLAVVYPMKSGNKYNLMEDGKLKFTDDTEQAKAYASQYIPDRSTDFAFTEEELQKFNDWVVKGYYYEQPPKFPVICVIDDEDTPIHVKVLSHYMQTHFQFGVVKKRNVPAMRKLFQQIPDPEVYPTFMVLLGVEPSSEEMEAGSFQMKFNIMPYIHPKYGDSQLVSSLINFLFVANTDYRKNMPGRMPGEPVHISNMDAIRAKLSDRVVNAANYSPRKSQRKSEL